ncbi:cytochrome B5-like heme steroid binding domain-containing protein [Cryptosporidium andersoni]|uniref:Cytochrome B5-like heme steroid binding domain-containing protein n=1 Tax=Cryptosporidium andersoni TaxID=117008 RepID=A0A1J4MPQ1_9CRYT|nr:cytochrome B5-like heme steroid binding domain-containing protein [Cryptosporidium andersoni]
MEELPTINFQNLKKKKSSGNTVTQRPGLIICKVSGKEDLRLTWGSHRLLSKTIQFLNCSIRKYLNILEDREYKIEVATEVEDGTKWVPTTIQQLVENSDIYTVRISRIEETDNDKVNKEPIKVHSMLNCGRHCANQMRYIQLMEKNKKINSLTPKDTIIKVEELKKHCTANDCWVSYNGKVYDITKYLDYHPGGRDLLIEFAGSDITEAFTNFHQWFWDFSNLETSSV